LHARWLYIAIAIVGDGLAGLAGGLLPEGWLERRRALMLAFAAGALLAAALIDILPDALAARGAEAIAWAVAAFAIMAVFERALPGHRHRRARAMGPVSPLVLLGSDALHNLADGIAVASTFLRSIELGAITSIAVIVHEVPEEIADYALLRAAGLAKPRALLALGGVQLTAAIGAAGAIVAASATTHVAGVALSISAGTFCYLAAADLLPEVVRVARARHAWPTAIAAFGLGVATVGLETLW
jgi:zinc and cadmium transporter